MPQDWFAQNAPKPVTAPSGDWFTQNAPSPPPRTMDSFLNGLFQNPVSALAAIPNLYKLQTVAMKNATVAGPSAEDKAGAANALGSAVNILGTAYSVGKVPAVVQGVRTAVQSGAATEMGKAAAREAVKRLLQGAGYGTAVKLLGKYLN